MKFTLLSGAYKNAGDFLIVKRCEEMLKYVYPDCDIVRFSREKDLTDKLSDINKTDAIIIAGGPALVPNVYPNIIPMVPDLNDIKPPIFAMALGIDGINGKHTLYNYKFNESTQNLWRRIVKDGFAIGCRDVNSVNVMQRNGFVSSMTGCAAWYDVENIKKNSLISDKFNGGGGGDYRF